MRRARRVPKWRADRDVRILELVAQGQKPRDIAVQFNLTEARIYQLISAAKSAAPAAIP